MFSCFECFGCFLVIFVVVYYFSCFDHLLVILILSLFLLTGCFENVPDGMVFIPSGEFTIGSNQVDRENHALSLGSISPGMPMSLLKDG